MAHVANAMPVIIRRREDTSGEHAVMAKETYAHMPIPAVTVTGVELPSAGAAVVRGTATIRPSSGPMATRWMFATEDGSLAIPGDAAGRWPLAVFRPGTFLQIDNA
jgi:hypothetical protein